MLSGPAEQIALLTDFGPGPYVGQVRLRLHDLIPDRPVVDLVNDLPAFRPDLSAYLLPCLLRDLPASCLCLCVVDPGVGGARDVLLLDADRHWLIGPDNGLLALVAQRARSPRLWRLGWRPRWMSDSFHARDLFVPLAARILRGEDVQASDSPVNAMHGADWPVESARLVYQDHYGNLMTGLRGDGLSREMRIRAGVHLLSHARTFCEVPVGAGFWYENAFGLVELAVNQGSASQVLALRAGDLVEIV